MFTDQSSSSDGPIDSWLWDFGDGSPNSSDQNANHHFTNWGSYDITLTVVSSNNCSKSYTQPIEVFDMPTASFNFENACFGDVAEFSNTSTAPLSYIVITY